MQGDNVGEAGEGVLPDSGLPAAQSDLHCGQPLPVRSVHPAGGDGDPVVFRPTIIQSQTIQRDCLQIVREGGIRGSADGGGARIAGEAAGGGPFLLDLAGHQSAAGEDDKAGEDHGPQGRALLFPLEDAADAKLRFCGRPGQAGGEGGGGDFVHGTPPVENGELGWELGIRGAKAQGGPSSYCPNRSAMVSGRRLYQTASGLASWAASAASYSAWVTSWPLR